MCAWNNHFCWPGTCGSLGLTQDCTCFPGFSKVSINAPAIDSGNTTCQPTKTPTILTCDTVAVGPNGEKKRAMSSAASSACEHLQDMYGNFRPSFMQFTMTSELTITISNTSQPEFIVESNFGVSDSTIHIIKSSVIGMKCFNFMYKAYCMNKICFSKKPRLKKYIKKTTKTIYTWFWCSIVFSFYLKRHIIAHSVLHHFITFRTPY